MIVFVLEQNGVTAFYPDLESLGDSLEMELESIEENEKFTISVKEMSEEDFAALPEFEGF